MKKIISTVLVCVLLLGCVFTLASCGAPNSDPQKAKAALEDKDYSVTLKEDYPGCVATIYAVKNDINKKKFDSIEIFYYKDEAAAKEAWKTLEKQFEAEAEPKKDTDSEIKYGIEGALIYKGTPRAVKAAK